MVKKVLIQAWLSASMLLVVVACGSVSPTELPAVSLVVTNQIIVDGAGVDPIPDSLEAIHGNQIVAVGQSADFNIPQDVTVLDAAGGKILPRCFNVAVALV